MYNTIRTTLLYKLWFTFEKFSLRVQKRLKAVLFSIVPLLMWFLWTRKIQDSCHSQKNFAQSLEFFCSTSEKDCVIINFLKIFLFFHPEIFLRTVKFRQKKSIYFFQHFPLLPKCSSEHLKSNEHKPAVEKSLNFRIFFTQFMNFANLFYYLVFFP